MVPLLRALSWSYVRRYPLQLSLTTLGVALGVATFSSVRTAQATLVDGLRTTIDRVAGRAHLQVTGVGGVPEDRLEVLRLTPGVEAYAPAIEQVVMVTSPPAGALLVLGVDLLADRRLREYAFDDPEEELDDPLEFLAQPDSVAVTQAWAARWGVETGQIIEVTAGAVRRRLTVRAQVTSRAFASAHGGSVAITDAYAAQDLFGRLRRFDRVDIRLAPEVAIDDGERRLRAALPGLDVETPSRRSAHLAGLITAFVASFDVSSGLAVLVAIFLVANVLRVSVERRRRAIGILRSIGATPAQIRRALLTEAALIGLLGGSLGALGGWGAAHFFLTQMGQAVRVTYGVGDAAAVEPGLWWLVSALATGLGAALLGAWLPARVAASIPPVEAVAAGRHRARAPVTSRRLVFLGITLLLLPPVLTMASTLSSRNLLAATVVSGALATLCLVGPIVGAAVVTLRPGLIRLAGVSGLLAADALLGQRRRTAATAATVAVALALVLGTGGYLHSFRVAFDRWLDQIITADLVVRASADLAPSPQRLPAALHAALLEVPGVERADAYRVDWVVVGGETAMLASFDGEGFLARTSHRFIDGDLDSFTRDVIRGRSAAVSENFARRYGLGRGAHITLDTPSGRLDLPIAAVLESYLSDRGLIMIDRRVFLDHWRDDRVGAYHVMIEPGHSSDEVQRAVLDRVGSVHPILVSTRQAFRLEAESALEGFYTLTRVTVALMLGVTLVGIVTALLAGVVDRQPELGLLRTLGTRARHLRRSVVIEALVIATLGLVLAIPLGAVLADFLETVVADHYAGFIIPGAYPWPLLRALLIGLPALAVAAAWLPARQASRGSAIALVRHE